MANQEYVPFTGKLDAATEFEPFNGTLDGQEPSLTARVKQGVGRAVDSAQAALTDSPSTIAHIAAQQARNALPQTEKQQRMAQEMAPYVDAANKSEGVVDTVKTWGAAGFKRAGQLMSNPGEAGKMIAEQLPNSLPGLAGGFAGAKLGAMAGTAVAPGVGTVVGGILGGVAGGFAGGYGLEKGSAMLDQVQKEAQARQINLQDESSVAKMVAEKQPEFEAAAQRKGVGTAGTDAVLNVATMGLAGMGGRTLAKEAHALSASVKAGTISATDAATELARLQAANAARNTLGAKALRHSGVAGAEMAGEGFTEGVGQKYAYGSVDAGDVIDESLLGLGTGAAMAMSGKAFNKAAGIVDQDATTRSLAATQEGLRGLGGGNSTDGWTTSPGAADPASSPPGAGTPPPEAPDFTTSPGAAPERTGGMDYQRDISTDGLSLVDAAAQDRAQAATIDFDQADTTPSWDTAPGAAPPRVDGIDMGREFDTSGLELDNRLPSERMGINPNAGPLSRAAVVAVEGGYAVQKTAPNQPLLPAPLSQSATNNGAVNVQNAAPAADPQAQAAPAQTPEAARGNAPAQTAAVPAARAGAVEADGVVAAKQQLGDPSPQSNPNGAANGTTSNQTQQAAPQRQEAPATVTTAEWGAADARAYPRLPQPATDTRSKDAAPQAGTMEIPASGPSKAQSDRKKNPGELGGLRSSEDDTPTTPRPATWRKNAIQAGRVAKSLGIDPTGKRLAQMVEEIEAADSAQNQAPAPVATAQAATENAAPAPGSTRIGRDQRPLSEGGKPFKTRKAAGDAKKLQPMMRVVSVPGGYALAEKTPAQLAAEERASRRLRNPNTSARGEPIPAHAFIAAAGGLNRVAASDMGVDGNPRIGNRTLFAGQGRGLSMDQATQMLIQDGYLRENATINDALRLIKTSLTRPQYNADGIGRIAEAETAARFEDYVAAQEEAAADGDTDPFGMADEFTAEELDEVGYTDADPALQAEVAALIAQAEAMDIDTYAILEDIARTYANATQDQYNAAARDALAQAIARSNQDGGSVAAQAAPAAEPATEQGLNQPEAPAALELAAQTQAEAAARQDAQEQAAKAEAAAKRAEDAAAKAEDERKRIAQASVRAADRFELGQDPLDSLTGQGSVFDAPAAKAKKPSAAQTRAKADLMNALADLGDILGKSTRMNILPEQEQKLLPVLARVLDAAFRLGYAKFKDSAKFALDQIRAHLGDDAADALTLDHLQGAYIAMAGGKQGADTKRAVIDIETKAEIEAHTPADPEAADEGGTAQDAKTLAESLHQAIESGNMPKDNPALKKLVEAFDGKPADQSRMKDAQEQLETAIAMSARKVVARNEGDRTTFDILLRMYESQPSLNIRTSTSITNQAYSTPAPLAFLASRLAGITRSTVAHEPTAGTGMLLIGADPKKALVNELNDLRISALEAQGFAPTQKDAATQLLVPEGTQPDAVVTNPPFGSIKDADGKTVKVKVDGFSIGQIDHLIAARALETMKDDGKATLILGASKVAGGLSTDDRIFFNWLYSHYNVAGHFEVEGDLYARQGAGWPVRVIVINGRQKTAKLSPVAGTIKRADNWNQVYEHFTTALESAKQAPNRTGGIAPSAVSAPAAPGGRRPQSSTGSTGNVAGTGPRVAPDRAERAPEQLGGSRDEQRLNAEPYVPQPQPGQSPAGEARPAKPAGDAALEASESAKGNEFQLPYTPRSARKDEGVLIPANMAQPTQDALSRLEDEVGDIDEFARKELGYDTVDSLHHALMGLQVDSVAMSIHQIKSGKAVVIADQTGIGKGRQAASIIRWAARHGMTPVFISVKPSLFTDMYGDLADIGTNDVTPFIMNGDAWVAGDGGAKLFANKPSGHRNTLQRIADNGQLPEGSNALFMTYSQINVDNVQRRALTALAPNAVFVLDESHNAAGASATGDFVISVLGAAKGVTYLSATYAKRPDNMPLYFKTDIGDAAADAEGLSEAMAAGGLPLQTVVSNNLVKAGQMFRRERSYDGVSIASTFDTPNRDLHERMSNEATKALRAIVAADTMFHEVYVKALAEEMAASGSIVQDSAGNQAAAGVQHTEFSSVVHNFVKQMLLGLKAQSAADEAIASLKRGEKPIIAVENTMGSFLNEYAAANGIGQGDDLGEFDYRTVLSRALDRSRVIVEVSPQGDKEKKAIPLSQLDSRTRAAYNSAQAVIDSLSLQIPVSPIDWMRAEIQRAGFSVAEITGRNLTADYSNAKKPVLSAIDAAEQKDKVNTTRLFNSGKLDALILNVAGSTGISLHASEKFEDQRQRHMIVAQAAGDINIFMQMLGRVHRTGQVRLPKYTILSVDLPTEKRPTAVLSIKMKSLNANTSSNTESATSVKSADILNKYGDQIVNQYLVDNTKLARDLGLWGEVGEEPQDDIARKATGRLALQPIEVQHGFYDDVEAQYAVLIDYLNKTNQNDLEPRTFDFDAKETRQEVLFEGPNHATPFGEDAIYGEYSIKAQGAPMTPEEIQAAMAESLEGKTPAKHVDEMLEQMDDQYKQFVGKLAEASRASAALAAGEYDSTKDDAIYDTLSLNKIIEAAGVTRQIGIEFLRSHAIGKTFRIDINSEPFNAVVTNIRSTHKTTGNPFSLSKIQVTVAVNGALRSLSIPATQFRKIEVSGIAPMFKIEQLFKEQPPNQRETAKIVTGNLLAAYGELQGVRGTIITFSKQDGTSEQGILLPKLFDYSKNTRGDYRLEDGAAALKFLQESDNKDIGRFGIMSRDGVVRALPAGQGVRVQVPKSKLKGGKYFLDRGLIAVGGDFVSQGSFMVLTTHQKADATKVLDLLMKKQALYALPSMAEEARALTGEAKPAFSRSAGEDGKSSVLSKNGKFKGWPRYNSWTRAEYNDVVSLLPAEYRNDPHRREPLSPADRDARAAAALPQLNAGLTKRTFTVDQLGNIAVDARDAGVLGLKAAAKIADQHGLGIYVTGVQSGQIKLLQDAGFVSEAGLGMILQRAAKTNSAPMPTPLTTMGAPAYGAIMSYRPRGFSQVMFSFAGQQAVTADQHALATAQQRLDAGEDAEAVRQETGWFQGKDGKWRYEISDKDASMKIGRKGTPLKSFARDLVRELDRPLRLSDVLDHPALFAAYPALKNYGVTFVPAEVMRQTNGSFSGELFTLNDALAAREALSTLLHEIQHGIQDIEGFATGGTPERFGSVYVEELRQRLKWQAAHLRSAQKNGGIDPVSGQDENTWLALARETANELGKHTGRNDPRYMYASLAGEVEARNTQARQGMTDAQRRATPPTQTADVADSEVIVVFNGKEMDSAPPPANAIRTPARKASDANLVATQQLVDGLTENWTRAPEIIVARNMEDPLVPQSVRDYDQTLKSQGATGEARGFIYQGKVYLLADQLNGPHQIAEVLFHEVLGHYGLRRAFGKGLTPILQQVATMRRKEMLAKAKEYGLDLTNERDRLTAAEEILAEMAQTTPEIGFVKRAIAVIRNWMRANVPGFQSLRLTDNDIIQAYILPARGAVTRSKETGAQSLERAMMAFSRAPQSRSAAIKEMLDAQAAWDKMKKGDAENITLEKFSEMTDRSINARTALADELVSMPDDGFALQAKTSDGRMLILTPSAQKAGKWQLTRFGSDGSPWGDTNFDTKKQAALEFIDEADLKTIQGADNEGAAFSRTATDQTQTEAFKRWFAGSRVVDAEGNPLVVYHGNTDDIAIFKDDAGVKNDSGWLGRGFYFTTNPNTANTYANIKAGAGNPNVMPVFLSIKNPYVATLRDKEEGALRGFGGKTDFAKQKRADLMAQGYDGVVLDYSNGGWANEKEFVAFRPEQIKSATGSNGDFDPANPDIRFSRANGASAWDAPGGIAARMGGTIKAVTATNIKERAGFKLTDYLGLGLQLLGRRQLVDIYGDTLPLDQYNRLAQQMEADKNEVGAEADALATAWAKLPDERQLAELMHDATLAQMDPAKPLVAGDNAIQHGVLRKRFNDLTPEAQKVYLGARDSYQAHHKGVLKAIKERIERSELKGPRKAALLAQMDDEFYKAVKGVYFPLARFGQYVVVTTGPDGKVANVSRAETMNEGQATRKQMLLAFPASKGYKVGNVILSKEFVAGRDAVGRGFMTELYAVLDKQDMDSAARAELEDTLGQLYLSSLPDLSWAKHGIHRKGTPGYSQDARRAFAQNMFHGARYLAKLRYSDLMQDELTAMQKHVDNWVEVPDADFNSARAQRVVDEFNKRHEAHMNPKSNPLSTALTSFGFIFHLGLSPASALVNLTQTALVAYPVMGAKWGFDKSAAALMKASQQAVQGKNDITGSLNEEERRAYDEAVRNGTIDVTMAHDLAGISQGEDAGVMWKIRPVMKWASFMFHHAERFNRQVTFVASYRLAREAGAAHEAAFEQATKATYDGHFDYSSANRPRVMQGNAARVLLLFKQYGQNMVYSLARSAHQSLKGATPQERTEARRVLGGLLAMHGMAAGALGLPMVTTLLAVASMLGGSDDEPWDAQVALQNMLADTFGQKPAEVLSHGLSRLTPWDISGRVGLDKLILPDIQEGLEGQRLGESAMAAALGPVAGIGINVLRGMQDMGNGHYLRGLESMLPAALRGPMRALRYADEGAQDKTGVSIQDEVSPAAIAGQAFGFSPSEVRLATEGKSAIMGADRALNERRSHLVTQFAMAVMAGDDEGKIEARDAIAAFNEKNPSRRISPMQLAQSVRTRTRRIEQAQDGVYLPKTRRDALEAGRFATGE